MGGMEGCRLMGDEKIGNVIGYVFEYSNFPFKYKLYWDTNKKSKCLKSKMSKYVF